jgi:ABC-2 type transport system permease protein
MSVPDLRGLMYREFKVLTGNRTNVALGAASVLVYIFLFATSMTRLVERVDYGGRSVTYTDFALPSLVVFSMVAAATTSATSLFQERLGRMDVELWSYPVRKSTYVAAKVTANTSMVLLQTAVALGLALMVFRLGWPAENLPFLAVACVVAASSLTGAYLLLATLVSTFERFTVLANVLGPVMLFASASFYPAESMPTAVRWVSWVNPMTYAIRAVRDAALLGPSRAATVTVALGAVAVVSWFLVARALVKRAREI